jgi:hypothetical protein
MYHAVHDTFFEPICWSLTCVNWTIVEMNHKSFLMQRLSSRKDCLFKWNEHACHKIIVVYFCYHLRVCRQHRSCSGSIWSQTQFFALNIKSRLCDHVISRQSLHMTW